MTIRIACPKCGSAHGIADRLMGREVRCPDCDARLQIPTAEQVQAIRDASTAKRPKRASAAANEAARQAAVTAPSPERQTTQIAEEPPTVVRRRNREETEMDMTPMVDVTFLLLIFFMVTAAFQLQKSIEVPNTKSEEPSLTAQPEETDQPDVVTVQVDEFNSFTVLAPAWEKEVPGKQNLINALRDAFSGIRGSGPARLVVQAHVDAKHRAVVDAMDAGTEAGFTELELMDVEAFDYR